MSYLFNLPDELKYTIFAFFDSKEIVRLYSRKYSDINSIFDSDKFWILKFNEESLPILYNNSSYSGWLDEYKRLKYSKEVTIQSFDRLNHSYNNPYNYLWCFASDLKFLDLIFSVIDDKKLINEIYNESIYNSNYTGSLADIIFFTFDAKDLHYHMYYKNFMEFDSDKHQILTDAVLLAKEYNKIHDILLKMEFYGINLEVNLEYIINKFR